MHLSAHCRAQGLLWFCASCLPGKRGRLASKLLRHVHPALVGDAALTACMTGMHQLRERQRTPV